MPSQLTLPWEPRPTLGREDFILAEGNRAAVAFIDSWPNWNGPAVLFGPTGSGKSHLAAAWSALARAKLISATALDPDTVAHLDPSTPIVVEDVDRSLPSELRDTALFALFERGLPFLLTGLEAPALWPVLVPDLQSRFAAVLHFPLWAPDDALLARLARKLFSDRQLAVPEPVITRMLLLLDRSPGAIRDFVARADARALAEKRAVTLALIRDILDST